MSDVVKNTALGFLRAYKRVLSPMFPPSCRYWPTCSEYAIEAVEQRGSMIGIALAIWRVLRCHPFARGGYDPVRRASDEHAHVAADAVTTGNKA